MQGNTNWDLIEPTNGGGASLEPGCYICKILDVKEGDDAKSGAHCLEVIYDIAEGEHAGHYSDDWGKQNLWAHSDYWYYGTENTNGMFRGRLDALEASNPNFKVSEFDNDEKKLIGLKFGAGIQKRYYTGNDGEDKETLEIARIWDTDYVRSGKAKLPEPRDNRVNAKKEKSNQDDGSVYDGDLPF